MPEEQVSDALVLEVAAGERVAYQVHAYGKVQGIGLRRRIKDFADSVGVAGRVINRPSGGIQAYLEGPSDAVQQVIVRILGDGFGQRIESSAILRCASLGYGDFAVAKTRSGEPEMFLSKDALETSRAKVQLARSVIKETISDIRLLGRKSEQARTPRFEALVKTVPVEMLPEYLATHKLPLKNADFTCSFSAESWAHTYFRQVCKKALGYSFEGMLDNKRSGQSFVRQLGFNVPILHEADLALEDVPFRLGTVIKPAKGSGSKGVFSLVAENRIMDLGNAQELNSFSRLREEMARHVERSREPIRWMVEDLVLNEAGEIPNDLKMLTFYGTVALVQEATRMPTRVCYYNRSGNKIATGRYEHMAFEGTGLLPEYIEAAERIGSLVPSPFLRIDFLKSGRGPVFGEFTPRPGNFHTFDGPTDRWLGKCFVEARARLTADLIKGKKFVEFERFLGEMESG